MKLLFKKQEMLEHHNSMKGKHINCKEKINDEYHRCIGQLSINNAIWLEEKQERELIDTKSNKTVEDLLEKYYLLREHVSNNFALTDYSWNRLEITYYKLKQQCKEKEIK